MTDRHTRISQSIKSVGLLFLMTLSLSVMFAGISLAQPATHRPVAPRKEDASGSPTSKALDSAASGGSRPDLDCRKQNGTGMPQESATYQGTSRLLAALADGVSWQPRTGRIRFTIRTTDNTVPAKALNGIETAVCFGWPPALQTSPDTADTVEYFQAPYLRTVDRTDNSITYETGLPDRLWSKYNKTRAPTVMDMLWYDVRDSARGKATHVYDGIGLVPLVHMRVVARSETTVQDDPNLLSTELSVGVPFRAMAWALVLALMVLLWILLWKWGGNRKIKGGLVLRVISNGAGYASLTQFQILLWTLVIAGGLTYVMAITGSLIDVPVQELALLGIAGFSALSASIAANRDKAKTDETQQTAQPVLAALVHPIPLPPPPPPAPPVVRTPQWSDLVIWDGSGDVDVTRLQMLVFTVLTAGFVAIKICDDNTIPTIPDNIILLMGLANGMYIGGRFINTKSAD